MMRYNAAGQHQQKIEDTHETAILEKSLSESHEIPVEYGQLPIRQCLYFPLVVEQFSSVKRLIK